MDDAERVRTIDFNTPAFVVDTSLDAVGCTALYYGAQLGKLDIAEYLVRIQKADVNKARSDGGATPLWIAARMKKGDCAVSCGRWLCRYE